MEAGWLLPPGGGWVPWWVPWCLGKVSFNTPEFVGVPFFLVAPQKNGKFRCFFVTLVTAWFFCWLISINQHIDDALPSRRPRGSGPALWVFCRISMDFQSQDMTTSIIIINPSQTHPPLLQPMETAEPIELSPWQHTLQPPKRLQVGG